MLEVSYQDNYSNPVEDLNKSFADTSLSSNQASSFHTYPSADNHFPQNSHAPVSVNQLGYSVDFATAPVSQSINGTQSDATAPVSQSINGSKSNGPSFSGPSEQSLVNPFVVTPPSNVPASFSQPTIVPIPQNMGSVSYDATVPVVPVPQQFIQTPSAMNHTIAPIQPTGHQQSSPFNAQTQLGVKQEEQQKRRNISMFDPLA